MKTALTIRVEKEDRKAWDASAKKEEVSISAWVRNRCNGRAQGLREDLDEIKERLAKLERILGLVPARHRRAKSD
jgi:hypothetical protein